MSADDFDSEDDTASGFDTTRHTNEEVSFGFSLDDTLKAMATVAEATTRPTMCPEVREALTRALNGAADCIEQFRVSRIIANSPLLRVLN